MALPDSRFVACFPLQEYFVDKDTAEALSSGIVTFYVDSARTTPKAIYQQVQLSANVYGFSELTNPIILTSVGTFSDNNGNDIIPFLFPYQGTPDDSDGTIELYYITVYAAAPPVGNSSLQFTREAWPPNLGASSNSTTDFISSDNQIANPQFVEVNFSPITGTTISVTGTDTVTSAAPDWDIITTGTGTVTLKQTAITDSTAPSNPPYVLGIASSGVSAITLRQRLNNSPRLMYGNILSGYFVAASSDGGMHQLVLTYTPSDSGTPYIIADNFTTTTGSYTEFTANIDADDVANTDTATTGYIDIILSIPVGASITVSSFQLTTVTSLDAVARFLPLSTARQKDHLFHYYQNELLLRPKNTILTAWNFALNPYQFNTRTLTATTAQTQYIADQTIIHTTGALGSVDTGSALVGTGIRQALTIQANATSSNQFALIQYIPTQTNKQWWSYILSSVVRARIITSHNTQVGIKMRLISRAAVPPVISNVEPIASWAGANTDPVFSAGWTAIAPVNDPVYILPNAFDTTIGNNSMPAFTFNGFQLPVETNANQTLGIVVYTTNIMNNTATFDQIVFDEISLVPNRFAVDSNPYTYDDCLRQCQFFYEKSTPDGILVTAPSAVNAVFKPIIANFAGGNSEVYGGAFGIDYNTMKWITPITTLYTTSGTVDTVNTFGKRSGTGNFGGSPSTRAFSANWTATNSGTKRVWYEPQNGTAIFSAGTTVASIQGYILFHYAADARMGTF